MAILILNHADVEQLLPMSACIDVMAEALQALSSGPDHIRAEIGELLLGTKPGRISPKEITLFKSLGLAVEDVAAAEYVFLAAQERGVGASVAF